MNKRKLIGNTLFALGLLVAGVSLAAEAESATPILANTLLALALLAAGASFAAAAESAPVQSTPEQREAFRAEMKDKIPKMTPEQHEKMKMVHVQRRAEHMKHRAEHMEHRTGRLDRRADRMEQRAERKGS